MLKNIIKPGNNVFILYSATMDSKCAAYILKYLCDRLKINVTVEYTGYNGEIPKSLPNPEYTDNVSVVCMGVTLSKEAEKYIRSHFEFHIYENDGKRSVCKEVFDTIKKHPQFIHLNIDQPNVTKFVNFIADFHVRNDGWDEKDPKVKHLIYFNLASGMYNTFINSNGRNYYWDKLVSMPGEFLGMLLREGEEIYNYKKIVNNNLYRHITTEEICGYKCRVANKRDADSGFFQCNDPSIDFLIAYEASANGYIDHFNKIDLEKPPEELTKYEIHALIRNRVSVTFTVYRNNNNLNVLDFITPLNGSGHEKVGSFIINNGDLMFDFFEISEMKVIRPTGISDNYTDAVRKYRTGVQNIYIKRGLTYKRNMHFINNICDFDGYINTDSTTVITLYKFDNKMIPDLLGFLSGHSVLSEKNEKGIKNEE